MPDPERIAQTLQHPAARAVLWLLTTRGGGGRCLLDRIMLRYQAPDLSLLERILYALPFRVIDYLTQKAGASAETVRDRVFRHTTRRRALVNTARGIARYGLRKPQTFSAPLMVVWNFTQECNLRCRHCYQDAGRPLADELTLAEKLNVVDALADMDVPLLALSGGEPMMSPHFWSVLERAGERGFHTSLATNGTLLTPESVKRMRTLGMDYVEVSIDSVDPARHDAFRGCKGYWQRSVEGIRNAVRYGDGMGVGVASTITKLNVDELEDLIDFAIRLGVSTFYAFNFVPTGRGADVPHLDITPPERERMLQVLQRRLNEKRISIVSSAPQLGRACIQYAAAGDWTNTGHYGAGPGTATRVLARYIGGCGAGRCYLALQPNGDVTPCVFMSIKVGNVRTDDIRRIWAASDVFRTIRNRDNLKGHCRVCRYRYHCGGCRARAYGYFGDITAADPGCIFNAPPGRNSNDSRHGERELDTGALTAVV